MESPAFYKRKKRGGLTECAAAMQVHHESLTMKLLKMIYTVHATYS